MKVRVKQNKRSVTITVKPETYLDEATTLDMLYAAGSSPGTAYDDHTRSDSVASVSGKESAFFADWGAVLGDMKHCARFLLFTEWRGMFKDLQKWIVQNNQRVLATDPELEALNAIVISSQVPNRELTVRKMYQITMNLAMWMTAYQTKAA